MSETVLQHFNGHACYKDYSGPNVGGCAFHDHIHVQHEPEGYAQPGCDGGTVNPPKGGWPSPGSPNHVAFEAELDRQMAAGRFPGIKHGSGENCRHIDNDPAKPWSQHAYGPNALDIQAVDYAQRWAVLDPVYHWLIGPWSEGDEGDNQPPDEEGFLMALTEKEQDDVYAWENATSVERAGYICGTGINPTPSVKIDGKSVKVNKDSTVEAFGGSWTLYNAWRAGLKRAGADVA